MSIWFQPPDLAEIADKSQHALVSHLGIEVTGFGDDYLTATMPVDNRTRQPAGVLHGGASVTLAETVGTWAAVFTVDPQQFHCVGMEINANHIRPVAEGIVTATARPFHLGKSTQVWNIELRNEAGKLVCVSRLTIAVLPCASQYRGNRGPQGLEPA